MSFRPRWNGGGTTAFSTVGTNRKFPIPEPKNEANRDAWIRLKDKYDNATSDNQSFTYFRALRSLAACKEAITTYADAKKLQYVGDKCASIICPMTNSSSSSSNNNGAAAPRIVAKPRKNTKKTKATTQPDNDNGDTTAQSTLMDSGFATSTTSTSAPVAAKRARTTSKPSKGSCTTSAPESAKETSYQKAKQDAIQNWSHPLPQHNQDLEWKVLLLVDTREPKAKHILSKCTMSGIPAEERTLPIGDMTWVAQGLRRQKGASAVVEVELLLGTIIERKTIADLACSLFDRRYQEQRLRLKQSGVSQLLYLIEGDIQKEAPASFPKERVQMALMETRVYLGFHILRTQHSDETVTTLKRFHRRILQRTFPDAFGLTSTSLDALPSFASPDANARRQMQPLPVYNADPARNGGRRRQRRPESLVEMVMDTPPVPAFGETRFITYHELKCKVERDREAGTRTVGAIHAAMLRQVCGPEKVRGILQSHPTPCDLLQAYDEVAGNPKQLSSLVADCSYVSESKGGAVSRKVGPKASKDMYVAYCTTPRAATTKISRTAKPVVPAHFLPAETSATAASTCSNESISSGTSGPAGKRKVAIPLPTGHRLTNWGREAPFMKRHCASSPSSDSDDLSLSQTRPQKQKAPSRPIKTQAEKPLCVDLLSSDDDEKLENGSGNNWEEEKENNGRIPKACLPAKKMTSGSAPRKNPPSPKELVVLDDSSVDETGNELHPKQRPRVKGVFCTSLKSSSPHGEGKDIQSAQPRSHQDDDSLSLADGATVLDAIEIE